MDEATLDWALQLWVSMMSDDFSEYRRIWYPKATPGLEGKRSVTESAWDDMECSFEQSVVSCVEGAVKSLTKAQRVALEGHLELSQTVGLAESLSEARQKVWLALAANGCAN